LTNSVKHKEPYFINPEKRQVYQIKYKYRELLETRDDGGV